MVACSKNISPTFRGSGKLHLPVSAQQVRVHSAPWDEPGSCFGLSGSLLNRPCPTSQPLPLNTHITVLSPTPAPPHPAPTPPGILFSCPRSACYIPSPGPVFSRSKTCRSHLLRVLRLLSVGLQGQVQRPWAHPLCVHTVSSGQPRDLTLASSLPCHIRARFPPSPLTLPLPHTCHPGAEQDLGTQCVL